MAIMISMTPWPLVSRQASDAERRSRVESHVADGWFPGKQVSKVLVHQPTISSLVSHIKVRKVIIV